MKYKTKSSTEDIMEKDPLTIEKVMEEQEKDMPESEEKEDHAIKTKPTKEMTDLLVNQLQDELYNHNLYKTMAAWFGNEGLPVLEEYYNRRAKEELLHHDWIYWYLTYRGIKFHYPEIPEIKEEWDDRVTPFKLTVEKERETTLEILNMCDQAMEDGDWITLQWLQGSDDKHGKLVAEQAEEENISELAYQIAQGDENWYTKSKAIMNAYTGDLD